MSLHHSTDLPCVEGTSLPIAAATSVVATDSCAAAQRAKSRSCRLSTGHASTFVRQSEEEGAWSGLYNTEVVGQRYVWQSTSSRAHRSRQARCCAVYFLLSSVDKQARSGHTPARFASCDHRQRRPYARLVEHAHCLPRKVVGAPPHQVADMLPKHILLAPQHASASAPQLLRALLLLCERRSMRVECGWDRKGSEGARTREGASARKGEEARKRGTPKWCVKPHKARGSDRAVWRRPLA